MAEEPDEEPTPGTHVSIPISDLKIFEAVEFVSDGDALYIQWMPRLIEQFRLTYKEYWNLSVAEHQTFIDYVEGSDGSG